MLKKIICIALLGLWGIDGVRAQDHEKVWNFINKYDRSGRRYLEVVGQPMPEFHFNKKLNNKALRGKFVIMDFWASWCVPCRATTHRIDSVLMRSTDAYKDIQIIGVDHGEKNREKAREYWQKSGYAFPMVDGKAADACAGSVHAGHPTVLLIDGDGIVRVRWDTFMPTSIEFLKMAILALKTVPEQHLQITLNDTKEMIARQEWPSALYFLENMPEDDETSLLRFRCLLCISDWEAFKYCVALREKYQGTDQYVGMMNKIADELLNSSTTYTDLLKNGMEIAEELAYQHNPEQDLRYYSRLGHLRLRYGNSLLERARREIETSKKSK